MISLEELFCCVDDFYQVFEPLWHKRLIGDGLKHRQRHHQLCLSEIMTITIAFHQSHYRNFKAFYLEKVSGEWSGAFPGLVSYQRFIEWMPSKSDSFEHLSAQLFGSVYRSVCNGLHQDSGLS